MTSSISWIDADGLEVTLARMGARRRRDAERPLAAHGDSASNLLDEVATGSGQRAAEPRAEEVRERVDASGVIAGDADRLTDVPAGGGRLHDRLSSLVGRLVEHGGARAAFVIDEDGLPLVQRGSDVELLSIAASIAELLVTLRHKLEVPIGDSIDVELDDGHLWLGGAETAIGRYLVGQVVATPPDGAVRRRVLSELAAVFDHGDE